MAPGGFDFRPPHVRTLANDLAARDAMMRATEFINDNFACPLPGGARTFRPVLRPAAGGRFQVLPV